MLVVQHDSLRRFAVLCAVFAMAATSLQCNRDDAKSPAAPNGTSAASTGSPEMRRVRSTSDAYAAEFDKIKDETGKTPAKYDNAIIELTGTIKSVGHDVTGAAYVNLAFGDAPFGVMCRTREKQPWAKLAAGQSVTIAGKWPVLTMMAALDDCDIVDAGPTTAVTLTATALADEWAKDRDATLKKYKDKDLILTGEVAAKRDDITGAPVLTLKGNDKTSIDLPFGLIEMEPKPAAIAVGSSIKIFGQLRIINTTLERAEINSPLLITQ